MVRTRIAPSPTGFPHIGTIYQALFNYAFSKKNNGRFLVRIEDTDQARFVEGAEQTIYDSLDWFGLVEGESPRKNGNYGPYKQSERLPLYKKYAEELIEKGKAYYCFCTKDRLDQVRKSQQEKGLQPMYDKHCRSLSSDEVIKQLDSGVQRVVRMKIPENTKVIVVDQIRGEIEFNTSTIDDQVIVKSDGFPTYHLAVVIDDHLMEISHVVRAEEWLTSTPKHFLLYDYFGWEKPLFFHTPALRNPDKSKMSKRHGHTNVGWYKENGFLPEAIVNYLALLGWSHPEEKEVFPIDEFIELFDLKDIRPVGPIFDVTKLEWMNGVYIREKVSVGDLKERLLTFDPELLSMVGDESTLQNIVEIASSRIKTLKEFKEMVVPFLSPHNNSLTEEQVMIKNELREQLERIDEWSKSELEKVILSGYIFSKRIKFPDLYEIIIGQKRGLPIVDMFEAIGKKKSLELLQ